MEPAKTKAPWWQVAKTPRPAFILGTCLLGLFISGIVRAIASGEWPWYDVLYLVVNAVAVLWCFASGISLVKSRRTFLSTTKSRSRPRPAG